MTRILSVALVFLAIVAKAQISSPTSASSLADATAPSWLKSLYERMDRDNNELNVSRLSTSFYFQDTRAARASLYPNLTFSSALNKGKKSEVPGSSSTSVQNPSLDSGQDSSVGINNGGLSTSIPTSSDGWVNQVSTSYVIFSQLAVSESIRKADFALEKATVGESFDRLKKRSQLVQLLMEWQWLNRLREPLARAVGTMEKLSESSSRPVNRSLYNDSEHADLNEKRASVEYYDIKVRESLELVEMALVDLVPDLDKGELARLPTFKLRYEPPIEKQMPDLYRQRSPTDKKSRLDIASAESAVKVASWQRPWIPMVALNASASQARSFESGVAPSDSWSSGLVLSFNVFDGFLNAARRQQASIAYELTERKRRFEEDKTLLYLKHQRMKASVAAAEFRRRDAVVARKRVQMQDVARKRKLGVVTAIEESGAELEMTKAELEALESLKDQQAAILSIAVELDQTELVYIDPVSGGKK